MGEYANVTFEVDQRVGLLTLNRPSRRNALSLPLMGEFEDVLARVDGNRDLRSLVVTGAGDSFCVGADLHGPDTLPDSIVEDRDGQTVSGFREPAGRVTERIFRLRIPVIGAVNGDAVGGGATILAGMDYRVAADDARFGFVFTRRGVSPEGASTWFVPRLVGAGRATDWLLSGRIFDAAEALDAGFVARIVPKAEVLDAALEYASIFSTLTSPTSVAETRRLLAAGWGADHPRDASLDESRTYAGLADSPDAREGVQSFLDGRQPRFEDGDEEATSSKSERAK